MKRVIMVLLSAILFGADVSAQSTALQNDLALKYLVQQPAGNLENAPVIILLHGYGSNEKDLFELRNFFPKKYLVIAVRAPYAISKDGYQWYEMTNVNGVHDGNSVQLASSRQLIEKFIGQVVAKYKADPKDVYLMGFSQGAIMSYQVGLTSPSTLKGIGALSGVIYPSLKPLVKKTPELKKLKIFIAHGNVDERLPYEEGKAASDYLISLGLKPEFHRYAGMGHSISKDVLFDLVKWLE